MAYGRMDICLGPKADGGSCREFRGLCSNGFCHRHCRECCARNDHKAAAASSEEHPVDA